MIRHALTLAHEAALAAGELVGWTIAECWSQERNRLELHVTREGTERFLSINLDAQLPSILLQRSTARARRNTIDFFPALLGRTIEAITSDEGERIIRLHVAGGMALVLLMFGGGGGNALVVDDGRVVDSFRRYAGENDALLFGRNGHEIDLDALRATLRSSTLPPERALAAALPSLGRTLAAEALHRALLGSATALSALDQNALDRLLAAVDQLLERCEHNPRFLLYHLPDAEPVASLIALGSLEERAERIEEFEDVAGLVRAWRGAALGTRSLEAERETMLRRTRAAHERLERSIRSRPTAAKLMERAAALERDAALLLANLPSVERGAASVTLVDWEGAEHTVSLVQTLSPSANVDRLYRRARGMRTRAGADPEERARLEKQLVSLIELDKAITDAHDRRALEAIAAAHRRTLMPQGEPKEKGSPERFRRFVVSGGGEVYVGRNAANNDELTVRFARPNDLWFHARGTSGSHVVLRWGDAKSKPPKEMIRAAAEIAAFYSGAKNARMVPVAYTWKKHVRKPRGAAPGAVVMEREEVVMVEPKRPEAETTQGE